MNADALEDWALRTMQLLQDFCDDAQEAAGNPDGEDCLPDVRELMREFDALAAGLPAWQARIAAGIDDEWAPGLDL